MTPSGSSESSLSFGAIAPNPSAPLSHYLPPSLPTLETEKDLDPAHIREQEARRLEEIVGGHVRRCKRLRAEYMILANMLFELDEDEDEFQNNDLECHTVNTSVAAHQDQESRSDEGDDDGSDDEDTASESESTWFSTSRRREREMTVTLSTATKQDPTIPSCANSDSPGQEEYHRRFNDALPMTPSLVKPVPASHSRYSFSSSSGTSSSFESTSSGFTATTFSTSTSVDFTPVRKPGAMNDATESSNTSATTAQAISPQVQPRTRKRSKSKPIPLNKISASSFGGISNLAGNANPHLYAHSPPSSISHGHKSAINYSQPGTLRSSSHSSLSPIPFSPPAAPPPFAPFSTLFTSPSTRSLPDYNTSQRETHPYDNPKRRALIEAVFEKKESLRVGYVMLDRAEGELNQARRDPWSQETSEAEA